MSGSSDQFSFRAHQIIDGVEVAASPLAAVVLTPGGQLAAMLSETHPLTPSGMGRVLALLRLTMADNLVHRSGGELTRAEALDIIDQSYARHQPKLYEEGQAFLTDHPYEA